jgi:hypothetical protein
LVSPFRPVTVGSFTSGTTCQKISGVRHAKRTSDRAPRSAGHGWPAPGGPPERAGFPDSTRPGKEPAASFPRTL